MDPWKTIPTLAGRHVRREPLQASHAADLVQAVAMLTDRLLARESSPDGFVGMQESGPVYIGRVDRDIESLIAPHRRAVFA